MPLTSEIGKGSLSTLFTPRKPRDLSGKVKQRISLYLFEGAGFCGMSAMTPEGSGGGELPQPMSYHVFRNEDGDELLSIVNGHGMAYKFRDDGG